MTLVKLFILGSIFSISNFAHAITRGCNIDFNNITVTEFNVGTTATHQHYQFSAEHNGGTGIKFTVKDLNNGSILLSTRSANFGNNIPNLDLSVESLLKTPEGYYHISCY